MSIFRQDLRNGTRVGRKKNSALFRNVRTGLLVFLFSVVSLTAEEVDRLLVAVNGTVITEGDLYIARSLNILIADSEKGDSVLPDEGLDRLIELELIRQEMEYLGIDSEDEDSVNALMQELQEHNAGERGFSRLLEQMGIQEDELMSFLRLEFSILKFVDIRFREFVLSASAMEIEAYYKDIYVPQTRKSGLELNPLEEATPRIENILIEEQVNADFDQWVTDTRSNARIEYFEDRNDPKSEISGKDNQPGIME